MDRDIRVVRAGSDGEGVPLVVADFWAIKEKPLSGLVLHAGLGELDLNGVVWVADNLNDLSLASATDLSVKTVEEVETASKELPPPAFITDAVRPKVVLVKWRVRRDCVADETACCVCVHAK